MKNVNTAYKISNQLKTLKILIDLCSKEENDVLITPAHFEDNFPFLNGLELSNMLDILESKELIVVHYADYPDNFDIAKLAITPAGYNYFPQASYDNMTKWKERLWGFISGSLFTSIIAALIHFLG